MFALILIIAILMVIDYFISSSESSSSNHEKSKDSKTSTNEELWKTMGRAKCKCLECNQIVYIPTQYLERRYGVQNSKCPNCGWKMTKVKIIQTWGID